MTTLVDANYVLRWFLGDIPSQAKIVEEFLASAPDESLQLCAYTIAEITYVLRSQGYDRTQISAVIEGFCRHSAVSPLGIRKHAALDLYAKTTLDFEDCCLITDAKQNGKNVATFDKQLLKVLNQS